ncbi:MAG: hypothetical protein ABI851_02065 [Saprospiraceae bacterium]
MRIYYLIITLLSILNQSSLLAQGLRYPESIQLADEIITVNPFGTLTAKATVNCIDSDDAQFFSPKDPENPNYCYTWTVRKILNYDIEIPFGGSTYELHQCGESAVYIVQTRAKNNPNNIISTEAFIHYVIIGLEIWERKNISECMDEFSEINIEGRLLGIGVDRINTTGATPISLNYIGGINYRNIQMCRIKLGKFEGTIFSIPEIGKSVQTSDPKMYKLNISANWFGIESHCLSNILEINVYRLWIEKFYKADAPNKNNWQVVLDEDIVYEVQCINCTDFKWSFITTWGEPINNTSQSGNNMRITVNQINKNIKKFIDLNNSDYGDIFGNILVTCNYNGKKLTVTSYPDWTNKKFKLPLNLSTNHRYMATPKKAMVFFPRYSPTVNLSGIPMWVFYWGVKEFSNLKYIFNPFVANYYYDKVFEKNGYYFWGYGKTVTTNPWHFDIYFTPLSQTQDKITKEEGIHCFTSVMLHESKHVNFKINQWFTGYNPSKGTPDDDDVDLDLYRDSWEKSDEGKNSGFKVGPKGLIDFNDLYIYNNENSIGRKYEENLCENEQLNTKHLLIQNDKVDWSWTKDGNYQGKQWK